MQKDALFDLARLRGVTKEATFISHVGFHIDDQQVGVHTDQPLVKVGFKKLAGTAMVDTWRNINKLSAEIYGREILNVTHLEALALATYVSARDCEMGVTIHPGTCGYSGHKARKHLELDRLSIDNAWGIAVVTAHALYRLHSGFPASDRGCSNNP